MLEHLGHHCFDVEDFDASEIEALFTSLAEDTRKALRPGLHFSEATWEEVSKFVGSHRRRESRYVTTNVHELRETIWSVIRNLSASVHVDHKTDEKVARQLVKVKRAVESRSIELIKREVLAATAGISQAIEERQSVNRERMLELGKQLQSIKGELTQTRRKLEVDPLTKLYNRAAFDEHLKRVADLNCLTGAPACLLMIDVDHFKKINDTYGHPAGDEVLRRLSDCLVQTFPRKTDFIARYGGEEFAVIFQNDGIEMGRMLSNRALESVRKLAIAYREAEIKVTVSIGLAEYSMPDNSDSWVERCDRALYRAKESGRDRYMEASVPILEPAK